MQSIDAFNRFFLFLGLLTLTNALGSERGKRTLRAPGPVVVLTASAE
jgi:hypothetical protein